MYLLYGLLLAPDGQRRRAAAALALGLPIAVVVLVLLVAYVAAAHRRDSGGRIEREKPIEPTGRTRKGSGGATPTNERVGS